MSQPKRSRTEDPSSRSTPLSQFQNECQNVKSDSSSASEVVSESVFSQGLPLSSISGQSNDVMEIIVPSSPDSDLATSSSVYSFQNCELLIPGGSPTFVASPSSSESVVMTDITISQKTPTNRIADQTGFQFFQNDLTPFPTLNNTTFTERKHILRFNKMPPSRKSVMKSLKIELLSNETLCEKTILDDTRGPSRIATSTPHPNKQKNKSESLLPLSDEITLQSPMSSDPSFGFHVKSVKNATVITDSQHKFAAQYLSLFSVEIHANTLSVPDPGRDPIVLIVVSKFSCDDVSFSNPIDTICLLSTEATNNVRLKLPLTTAFGSLSLTLFDDEMCLLAAFLEHVESSDPDIIFGYEIEQSSLGYMINRANFLGIKDFGHRIGRIVPPCIPANQQEERQHVSLQQAKGRVFFSVWRLIRHELEHTQSYTFESTAFHVLHRRLPKFDPNLLSIWLRKCGCEERTLFYFIERAISNIQILIKLNLLTRTSELARLYGILFYDCLSRGSQYRVEAVMLRLARRLNFVAVTPSMQQRANQNAPECIPLTLEPISNYYKDPVIVLDFQSLYPSIMIAYNYSFDTCLGRIDRLENGGAQHLGCFPASYEIPNHILRNFTANDVNISPNGVIFVKRHIRRGILSAVVEDLLNSRLMVKASLKLYKDDPAITKLLDARQLGLKLLANVTYGYTAANFSGRMPCIEVADAIVRKGREALENAIAMVGNRRDEWGGAKVIYGDTDSLFVLVPGATVKEAFDIGAKIAEAVTLSNPSPMKLKLEKVFSRCVLQSKKRYCGFSYETVDQKKPELLSKGLENIRKDQCQFVAKTLEKCIKTLFSTDNNAQTIKTLNKEIKRLETGNFKIPELILSREYRGAQGYSDKGSSAAMIIANRRRATNNLLEPLAGDRVPYVITIDAPGTSIMQTAREPIEMLANGLRPNIDYYIRRQLLPALDRALGPAGIDVFSLLKAGTSNNLATIVDNHRVRMVTASKIAAASSTKVITLTQMYTKRQCAICGTIATTQRSKYGVRRTGNKAEKLCDQCKRQQQNSSVLLAARANAIERKIEGLEKLCQLCCRFQPILSVSDIATGISLEEPSKQCFACSSPDCPIFYEQSQRESLKAAADDSKQIALSFNKH